ncbi:hypothetical protein V6Z12_A08G243600 [Gossypium hirsutum]
MKKKTNPLLCLADPTVPSFGRPYTTVSSGWQHAEVPCRTKPRELSVSASKSHSYFDCDEEDGLRSLRFK